jgi:hypothetical protein
LFVPRSVPRATWLLSARGDGAPAPNRWRAGLRPPEVRRVVELKQSMIVKAGDAVVNPVCCLKARRRTYMLT